MAYTIDYNTFVDMLRAAAAEIRAQHEFLSKLDSAGGDGDHGTTMVRAMSHLEKAIDAVATPSIKTLLNDVGWGILGVDGGATGPLLGTLFMSMGEAAPETGALDAPALAAAFEAGLAGVRAQTKAQVGDKTMIDTLVPAVDAIRASAAAGDDARALLQKAAEAAEAGALSTVQLQAKFGRARNIKEQSIGTQDPGATSMALIFKGFLKGVETHA